MTVCLKALLQVATNSLQTEDPSFAISTHSLFYLKKRAVKMLDKIEDAIKTVNVKKQRMKHRHESAVIINIVVYF